MFDDIMGLCVCHVNTEYRLWKRSTSQRSDENYGFKQWSTLDCLVYNNIQSNNVGYDCCYVDFTLRQSFNSFKSIFNISHFRDLCSSNDQFSVCSRTNDQLSSKESKWLNFILFRFLVSVFYSKAKIAAACSGIIYLLTYVPCMYISIREDLAQDIIPRWAKMLAVS